MQQITISKVSATNSFCRTSQNPSARSTMKSYAFLLCTLLTLSSSIGCCCMGPCGPYAYGGPAGCPVSPCGGGGCATGCGGQQCGPVGCLAGWVIGEVCLLKRAICCTLTGAPYYGCCGMDSCCMPPMMSMDCCPTIGCETSCCPCDSGYGGLPGPMFDPYGGAIGGGCGCSGQPGGQPHPHPMPGPAQAPLGNPMPVSTPHPAPMSSTALPSNPQFAAGTGNGPTHVSVEEFQRLPGVIVSGPGSTAAASSSPTPSSSGVALTGSITPSAPHDNTTNSPVTLAAPISVPSSAPMPANTAAGQPRFTQPNTPNMVRPVSPTAKSGNVGWFSRK